VQQKYLLDWQQERVVFIMNYERFHSGVYDLLHKSIQEGPVVLDNCPDSNTTRTLAFAGGG
jgi:hypothetical protein